MLDIHDRTYFIPAAAASAFIPASIAPWTPP
jgi:hypothetical protein